MTRYQSGILDPVPAAGRYLYFDLKFGADALVGLKKMQQIADGYHTVVGIGHSLLSSLAREIPGLPVLPVLPPMKGDALDLDYFSA